MSTAHTVEQTANRGQKAHLHMTDFIDQKKKRGRHLEVRINHRPFPFAFSLVATNSAIS